NDQCCTTRLENFTVNIYADDGAGQPGALVNSALFPNVAPSADLGPAELTLALPDPAIGSFKVDKPVIPAGEP
ncbi:MAG: hypothetical protein GWO24_29705, partial [Akkermansiaceae bacterium]|nr:hypothetical protein [Akkermansiaceae bacterium]